MNKDRLGVMPAEYHNAVIDCGLGGISFDIHGGSMTIDIGLLTPADRP